MKHKKQTGKLKIFLGFYKPHIGMFTTDMVCACTIAGIDLTFPLVSKYAMENLLPNSRYTTFFVIMGAVLCSYVLRSCMSYIVTYYGHSMGVLMEADMRSSLFSHIQKLSFKFYDKTRTGHLMSRVINDLFEITELAHHGPEDVVISLLTLIGSLTIMLIMEWRLALVVCVIAICMILFVVRTRRRMMKASRDVKEKTAGINAELESSISGVRVAKAFANEQYEVTRFMRGNEKYKTSKKAFYKAMGIFVAGMDFFMLLPSLAVIIAGGYLAMKRGMPLSVLLTFTLYIATFTGPIRRVSNFVEQYAAGMAGFERYLELMAIEPEIADAPGAQQLWDVQGHIQYKDVTFAYDDGVNVLQHVNLDIRAGSTLALVGPSGGGKSTLCHLLPRFYEATEGDIYIDGKNIKEVTVSSLRESIGIVQQDVFLFADTIRENIRYGRITATDEQVEAAARRAEIHDDIMNLPNGYDTYVGERGVMLSGGQKQRVSIARLFLKNPPILILDEATSALDTYTEQRIQEAFERLSEGRTTLVIAHRLSTIKSANEIIVVDDEGIKERGTHDELIKKGGEYAWLHTLQFKE